MAWLKGTGPFSVVPAFNEYGVALHMNRYCEIGWMVHRLLPLLQPKGLDHPAPWKENGAPLIPASGSRSKRCLPS